MSDQPSFYALQAAAALKTITDMIMAGHVTAVEAFKWDGGKDIVVSMKMRKAAEFIPITFEIKDTDNDK